MKNDLTRAEEAFLLRVCTRRTALSFTNEDREIEERFVNALANKGYLHVTVNDKILLSYTLTDKGVDYAYRKRKNTSPLSVISLIISAVALTIAIIALM